MSAVGSGTSFSIERVALDSVPWARLEAHDDHTVFQRRPWLAFLAQTQGGEPIALRATKSGEEESWVFGVLVRRFGVKIFGSSFPGWSTPYIGICGVKGQARSALAEEVLRFAHRRLGCLHAELSDPLLVGETQYQAPLTAGAFATLHTDLQRTEDEILGDWHKESKRVVRKSAERGVQIEVATDHEQFIDEYYAQLLDVFEKQSLLPPFPKSRALSLVKHLAPHHHVLLLRATHPDIGCIGTTITVGAGRWAELWGTASHRDAQRLLPNEPMLWRSIVEWRARGVQTFDWGGFAEYKARKYGGRPVDVPWLRAPRWEALNSLRDFAQRIYWKKNKLQARLRRAPAAAPGE